MEGYRRHRGNDAASSQGQAPRHSFAPSTHNWVHQAGGPPPPQPVSYPTPVRTLRPLPNPYEQRSHPLRVVNNPDPEHHLYSESEGGSGDVANSSFARPPKKKKALDKWMKGIRRIPQNLFRHKASSQNSTAYATASEGFDSPAETNFTGNTLPGYSSKPTSPLAPHVRPAMQQMQNFQDQYHPQVASTSQVASSSYPRPAAPMPDVVRLSTASTLTANSKRRDPSHRVMPPSDSFLHETNHNAPFPNQAGGDRDNASIYGTPQAARATIMVYSNSVDNRHSQSYSQHPPWANHPTPHPTPPPPATSPGLSYVSEEPPPVLIPGRTISHHSSLHAHPPPPIEIPVGPTESMRRISYASQASVRRDAPQGLIPGAFPSSEASTAPIFHSAAPSTHMDITYAPAAPGPYATPEPSPPAVESSNPVPTTAPADAMSPVSMHQVPTADYRKMTLTPSPDSNLSLSNDGAVSASDHMSSTSGYYDPSFSSQLNMNRFERFFKTLYHMPWVSHARVTADYAPGEGIGRKPAKKIRSMTSWYRGLGQGRAKEGDRRGSGGSLDLLSSGTASPRMSLGASAALLMDDGAASAAAAGHALLMSGAAVDARRRESASTGTRKHDRDYERRSRGQGRRKAATWLDSKYESGSHRGSSRRHRHRDSDDERDEHHHHHHHHSEHQANPNAPSPLIPSVYPFPFPSYAYTGFPAYQMPPPQDGAQMQQPQPEPAVGEGNKSPVDRPRGPRPLVPQQSFMYAVPAQGMYTYPTQMIAASPQPVYLVPPAALTAPALHQTASSNGDNDAQGDAGPPPARPLRHQISTPTLMYLQPVPGAF